MRRPCTEGFDLLGQYSVDSSSGFVLVRAQRHLRAAFFGREDEDGAAAAEGEHAPTIQRTLRARSSLRWARGGFGVSGSVSLSESLRRYGQSAEP